MVERRQVTPGEVIASGNYQYGPFIEKRGEQYIALRVGVAEVSTEGLRLSPASGPYIPRAEDQVIGKVKDLNGFGWVVDINSFFDGFLPASFVFGRDFSPATHDLASKFALGDMIGARIESFERLRDPQLSIRGEGYGKIPTGEIVKISPTRVPRVIGKRGAMINMIMEATGSDIQVGQNGVVIVNGPPEGVTKAVKAIGLIDRGAAGSDLVARVQEIIGGSQNGT
ncbi:MAG: KH domain-containing protein [archaeon]|nr:MAG: KH domain-containing protein [archaeon]